MPFKRALLLIIFSCACGDDDASPRDAGLDTSDTSVDVGTDAASDTGSDTTPAALELSTTAFADGEPVPMMFRCGPPIVPDQPGGNVSPALTWSGGPAETMSWAVVVRDRSAGDLVHWVIYDIPLELDALPEGIPDAYMPIRVDGARQAEIQGSGFFGYFGPCSGGRGNTYEWTLHAIDTAMLAGVDRTTTDEAIAVAVESASIDSASFTGLF